MTPDRTDRELAPPPADSSASPGIHAANWLGFACMVTFIVGIATLLGTLREELDLQQQILLLERTLALAAVLGVAALLLRRPDPAPVQKYRDGVPSIVRGTLPPGGLLQRIYFGHDDLWVIPGPEGLVLRRRNAFRRPESGFHAAEWIPRMVAAALPALIATRPRTLWVLPAFAVGWALWGLGFSLLVAFDAPRDRRRRTVPWRDVLCAVESSDGVCVHVRSPRGSDSLQVELTDRAKFQLLELLEPWATVHRTTPVAPPVKLNLDLVTLRAMDEWMERISREA